MTSFYQSLVKLFHVFYPLFVLPETKVFGVALNYTVNRREGNKGMYMEVWVKGEGKWKCLFWSLETNHGRLQFVFGLFMMYDKVNCSKHSLCCLWLSL